MAFPRCIKRVLSKHNIEYHLHKYSRRSVGGFDYGNNDHPLVRFDLAANARPLHDEDSFFMKDDASFGVADGVGGWNNVKGGNPKEFSNRVMQNCVSELDLITSDPNGDGNAYINSRDLLVRASMPVMCDDELLGGSTALIGMIINKNILSIANIGDSRFYIFRRFPDRQIPILYFISPEQRFSFNAPIQLSPKQYWEGNSLAVDPNLWSEYYEIPITIGDIVVFVTDGVSDNLFANELQSIVVEGYRENMSNTKKMAQGISEKIVKAAVTKQESSPDKVDTPFGTPKADDTTCVVGVCVSAS